MPLNPQTKKDIIEKFKTVDNDTGSPEVQIALLSYRIDALTLHLKEHTHDTHSRRGLLSMIAKRRRLINYLEKIDKKRSNTIARKIGLKTNEKNSKKS